MTANPRRFPDAVGSPESCQLFFAPFALAVPLGAYLAGCDGPSRVVAHGCPHCQRHLRTCRCIAHHTEGFARARAATEPGIERDRKDENNA